MFSGLEGEAQPICSQVFLIRGSKVLRFMDEQAVRGSNYLALFDVLVSVSPFHPPGSLPSVSLPCHTSHSRDCPLPPAIHAGCHLLTAFSQRQGKITFHSPGGLSLLEMRASCLAYWPLGFLFIFLQTVCVICPMFLSSFLFSKSSFYVMDISSSLNTLPVFVHLFLLFS